MAIEVSASKLTEEEAPVETVQVGEGLLRNQWCFVTCTYYKRISSSIFLLTGAT
jgi:hypothetical protein